MNYNDDDISYLIFLNDNNVHLEVARFICGRHLVIIGLSEAEADLMARKGLQIYLTTKK